MSVKALERLLELLRSDQQLLARFTAKSEQGWVEAIVDLGRDKGLAITETEARGALAGLGEDVASWLDDDEIDQLGEVEPLVPQCLPSGTGVIEILALNLRKARLLAGLPKMGS